MARTRRRRKIAQKHKISFWERKAVRISTIAGAVVVFFAAVGLIFKGLGMGYAAMKKIEDISRSPEWMVRFEGNMKIIESDNKTIKSNISNINSKLNQISSTMERINREIWEHHNETQVPRLPGGLSWPRTK